ncbi:hypothetical protein Nepgr_012888 [Nepenthes gracilis]|uniref:Uncharacterized protein n=1 Tax=Nepenthes gracilis TaxID=150966 RepID=A0AAD3SGX5_NEPGR|nr:hypothetical protein Nepgr_012888 [Nepenthes gracilis]
MRFTERIISRRDVYFLLLSLSRSHPLLFARAATQGFTGLCDLSWIYILIVDVAFEVFFNARIISVHQVIECCQSLQGYAQTLHWCIKGFFPISDER